jgi:hypothetical protein
MLTYYCWFKINKDSPGDVFPCPCLTKESVEGVITTSNGLVTGHLTIRLDAKFQTIQLPACIANLDTGLANMDGNTLTLKN